MRELVIIVLFFILAAAFLVLCYLAYNEEAGAAWSGYPLEDQTGNWYQVREWYDPIGQLYSAIVERCEATGETKPNIVETWTCSAGTNQQIVVSNGLTFTNWLLVTTNITKTNQLKEFEYTYNDHSGGHTATAFPYLTHYFMGELDDVIDNLWDRYTPTNLLDDGSMSNYFVNILAAQQEDPNSGVTDWPPYGSKAHYLHYLGIGYVEDAHTNAGGYVTNGTGYFTRQPPRTSNWQMAECVYSNAWGYRAGQNFDQRYYEEAYYPVITYVTTGSVPAVDVTLSGRTLTPSSQALSNDTETISISAGVSNTPCTKYWYEVTNITVSGSGSDRDSVVARWTNSVVLYGDRPFRLYARDLDERYKVLDGMRMCWMMFATGDDPKLAAYFGGVADNTYGDVTAFNKTSWPVAKAEVESDYAPTPGQDATFSIGTWGVHTNAPSDVWRAAAEAGIVGWAGTNFSTALAHQMYVHMYWTNSGYTEAGAHTEWYNPLTTQNIPQYVFGLVSTGTPETTAFSVTRTYGSTSFPAWVREPTNNEVYKGIQMQISPVGFARFDVTNGFVYK